MSYTDPEFWVKYRDYVRESRVRHEFVFRVLFEDWNPDFELTLLDLGCGQCCEAYELMRPTSYLGIDLAPAPLHLPHAETRCFDYRDLEGLATLVHTSDYRPQQFASLFSSELTGNGAKNLKLYDWMFRTFRSMEAGIVSGIYYSDRRTEEKVIETDGLTSYQTIGDLADAELFTETRLTLRAPSTMFGPQAVEIWRLFSRK